ncbi:transcriptional regulator [Candidatus Pacearchaeota archaeon]|nr:transcriptional regulator [Candidatus Pacearchaeota archaeon]
MEDLNKRIICQSCAMPLKKSEDFGTENDESKSKDFCHFCYKDGKFTDEGITLNEKVDQLVDIAISKLGLSEDLARTMAKTKLPTLKRWKN